MRALGEGIVKNISAAHYVALLMSNMGHNLPLICESCWDYCEVMLADYKFAQVMHVLQLVLPYYIESTDTLLKLDK